MPLHAVVNYNGQLTGQDGVHSRWESELFERNRSRAGHCAGRRQGRQHPRDFMFDVLLASNRAAANVLESDAKAAEGREFYDDAYFEAFAQGHAADARAAPERIDHRRRLDDRRRLGTGRQAGDSG